MTSHRVPLLSVTCAALLFTFGAGLKSPDDSQGTETIELAPKALQKWTFILPNETWTRLSGDIAIPHGEATGFAVDLPNMMTLSVDTDGDGRVDADVKGVKGFLTLHAKDADGKPFQYPVRFQNDGSSWTWSTGGALCGTFHNRAIQVIDQNNNGNYDDYGVDAMIVGPGEAASFLSKVINVGGKLFNFEITRNGRDVTLSPFTGESGVLDASKHYKSSGKLVAAVVKNGEMSFNIAGAEDGFTVPAGTYKLAAGYTELATESVWIKTGKMPAIEVKPKAEVDLEWGSPVTAEFDYKISGETITVPPDVRFFGSAGEEYHTFKPNAKSPKIIVVDKITRKELTSGRFGGC